MPPRGEDQEAARRDQETLSSSRATFSEGGGKASGQDECRFTGNSSYATLLQTDPEGPDVSTGQQRSVLRHTLPAICRGGSGAGLVDPAPAQLEWEVPGQEKARLDQSWVLRLRTSLGNQTGTQNPSSENFITDHPAIASYGSAVIRKG